MSKGTFETDINFCPECGSILPLPGAASVVTCYSCKYQINVEGNISLLDIVYFFDVQIVQTADLSKLFAGQDIDNY